MIFLYFLLQFNSKRSQRVMPSKRIIVSGEAGEKIYDFFYSDCSYQRYGSGPFIIQYRIDFYKFESMDELQRHCQNQAQKLYDKEQRPKSNTELNQNKKPNKPKKQKQQQSKSSLSEGICWLLFAILIWPAMLIFIILAGTADIVLFILSVGLCFGKCKDPKRTWFSYSCVRGASKCASEMVTKICDYLTTCSCCCCCYLTIPIGLVLVILGFMMDLIAWLLTGFYCFGYCCPNETFLEWSLGRRAWFNLKRCLQRVRDCN